MNKRRRAFLHCILDDLERLRDPIDRATAIQLIEKSQLNLRKMADEEEEALDNRPESFQWSTANDDMSENISDLNQAADDLEILAEQCQELDMFDYEPIKSDVIKIVNTIKRTIHR